MGHFSKTTPAALYRPFRAPPVHIMPCQTDLANDEKERLEREEQEQREARDAEEARLVGRHPPLCRHHIPTAYVRGEGGPWDMWGREGGEGVAWLVT